MTAATLRRRLAFADASLPVYIHIFDEHGDNRILEALHNNVAGHILKQLKGNAVILHAFDPGAMEPKNGARMDGSVQLRLKVMWLDLTTRQRELLIRYAQRNKTRAHSRMFHGPDGDLSPEKWNGFAEHVDGAFPYKDSLFTMKDDFMRMRFPYYTQLRLFLIARDLIDGDVTDVEIDEEAEGNI